MGRKRTDSISAMYSPGRGLRGRAWASDNPPDVAASAAPEFIAQAVSCRISETAAREIVRRVLATGRDLRARRITPAGGVRRIERLAIAAPIGGRP